MDTRVLLRALFAVAMVFVGVVQAREPASKVPDAYMAGAAIGRVEAATDRAYRDALAAFDSAQKQAPDSLDLAMSRCAFLQTYGDIETGRWLPGAEEELAACTKHLRERWPNAPQVALFELESLWGEEAATRGEAILKSADQWPASFRRDLLAKTSMGQEFNGNSKRSGELALMAVRLGDDSRIGAAANYLATQGKHDEAAALLAKSAPSQMPNDASDRVRAALAFPDPKAALAQLRHQGDMTQFVDREVAARAYLRAGDFAAAHRALKGLCTKCEQTRSLMFEAAMGARDYADAAKLVDLTDRPNFAIHLSRFATLAMAAPMTLINPSMLQGLAICIAWLTVMVLAPGVVLVPAHYRGLARRLKGKVGEPLFPVIGLWRAWYGVAVATTVPMVVMLLVQPDSLVAMAQGEVTSASQMFRTFLIAEIVALVLLLPALIGMNRRQLIGDRAALRSWWIVLLIWVALIGIGMLLGGLHHLLGVGGETAQTRMVAALVEGGSEVGGAMLPLVLVALIGPIFEELAFRGLLLGGLSRHISFGWANVVQAMLFAVIHNDPPRLPYYFAMGLFAGWLVRRTGSLGPAIALHVLNNAVAIGALLWLR